MIAQDESPVRNPGSRRKPLALAEKPGKIPQHNNQQILETPVAGIARVRGMTEDVIQCGVEIF